MSTDRERSEIAEPDSTIAVRRYGDTVEIEVDGGKASLPVGQLDLLIEALEDLKRH